MRLEDDEHALTALAQRVERGRDFGRMMPVIVEDLDAVRVAAALKPTRDSPKAGERALSVRALDACELEDCERHPRVSPIVVPGHGELTRVRFELVSANHMRHIR